MLLQTNSYIVPPDRRVEHARLMTRFKQSLARMGCDYFEVFEQVGPNWNNAKSAGRFVQIMRFRDRKHHQAIQAAERTDAIAQQLIREFCDLIDMENQLEQRTFVSGFYLSALPVGSARVPGTVPGALPPPIAEDDSEAQGVHENVDANYAGDTSDPDELSGSFEANEWADTADEDDPVSDQ